MSENEGPVIWNVNANATNNVNRNVTKFNKLGT